MDTVQHKLIFKQHSYLYIYDIYLYNNINIWKLTHLSRLRLLHSFLLGSPDGLVPVPSAEMQPVCVAATGTAEEPLALPLTVPKGQSVR